MIFSSPTEYAIRGLSEMVIRGDGQRMMLDDLIAGTNLPRDFMAKVFQKLVHAGILRSAKGRGGGFTLARQPHQITLMDISEAIDGPQTMDRCVVGLEKCNDHMLNQEKLPGCYLHRSNPNDVARSEHLTFICTPSQDMAGPTNNWMETKAAYASCGRCSGCMRGRTMYVVPFVMGPIGSPLAKVGVQLTDSLYVASAWAS
jgi:Rrf2 family protein